MSRKCRTNPKFLVCRDCGYKPLEKKAGRKCRICGGMMRVDRDKN